MPIAIRVRLTLATLLATAAPLIADEPGNLAPKLADRDPGSLAVRKSLDAKVDMPFKEGFPLDKVLRHLREGVIAADAGEFHDHVDPIALSRADLNFTVKVVIDTKGETAAASLRRILGPLGLGATIKDGVVRIGLGSLAHDGPKLDDGSNQSLIIRENLEVEVDMPFATGAKLSDVLDHISRQLEFLIGAKPKWSISPEALIATDASWDARVVIETQGEPVRTSLRKILDPLGLTYALIDGGVVAIPK